ncbi:MAG: biopolymer transporter ExbD [Labilithrix sp.]|nr:biopolymer transporter ExbD [Labilithrix sp.]
MGMSSGSKDGGMMTDINVTPLVDVVLVLLVLMMVTATAMANKSIPVELPKARSGESTTANKPLVLSVDESGALFLDATRADDAAVRARAREAAASDPHVSAVLAADARARHERVVHALELLRSERIVKIAIVVQAAP